MPAKVDKFRVNKDFGSGNDKRRKLTDEQRVQIVELSKKGYSQRQLASMFDVSRRLIGFIVNPDKLAEFKAKRKGKSKEYYSTEKHRKYMRVHREHKRELLEQKDE